MRLSQIVLSFGLYSRSEIKENIRQWAAKECLLHVSFNFAYLYLRYIFQVQRYFLWLTFISVMKFIA